MENLIIYSAIVFNSKNVLLIVPPLYEKIYAHHTTLLFGNQNKPSFNGKPVSIKILKEFIDFNCQTLEVQILDEEVNNFYRAVNNSKPHITISCKNNIKPVYSNNFFNGNITPNIIKNKSGIITGVVGCFLKNNTWDFSK